MKCVYIVIFYCQKPVFFPFKGSINCERHLPTEVPWKSHLSLNFPQRIRKHPLWSSESRKYRLLFSLCLFFFLLCFALFCQLICFVVVLLIYLNNCYLIKCNTNKLCSNQVILFSQFWRELQLFILYILYYCNIFYKTKTVATCSHRLPFIFFVIPKTNLSFQHRLLMAQFDC